VRIASQRFSASGELYRQGESELEEKIMPCLPTVDGRCLELSASALEVHRCSRSRVAQLLAVLAVAVPVSVPAANFTWDGNAPFGGGNSRWSRGVNWAGNIAPQANQISGLTNTDLTFAGSLKLSPLLTATYYIHSLTFAAGSGSFQLTPQSGQTLYLGSGGITNNSANLQRINPTLSLRADQLWSATAGNLAINGLLDLNDNALTIAGNYNVTINNRIQDTGELIKNGLGTLTLGGTTANTFSGGLTINSGTVTVAKANALGTGPLTLNGGVLNLGGYSLTASSLSLLGGTISSTSGGISSSSGYQLQSGTVSSSLGGAGGLLKTTSGTVTLNAANTYTGGTQIAGGRLTVNNLTGSGTGNGPVLVGSGGLLAGTGSIGGYVTNAPGGSISAGNDIGVLNLGSTIWFGGATNRWDISDAAGTAGVGWDLLNINGTLTLAATASDKAVIDITSFTLGGGRGQTANFDPFQNYLWTIVQTSGGVIFQPGDDATTVFDILTGNFVNPNTGGRFGVELSPDGRSLNITYNSTLVVPEPNMLAMTLLGLCGVIYSRRFCRNW
jgi:autotransporter-associated beta strand protein